MFEYLRFGTDELKTEYVELYNRYMTLSDDSEQLDDISKQLCVLEGILTQRFLFESGYTVEKKGDFNIYVKQ